MEIKNDFIEILSSLIDERNKKENILLQCLTMFAELRALKRAWRHGRAWKMKIRAWKNQDPCFNVYMHIYALLHKYPV